MVDILVQFSEYLSDHGYAPRTVQGYIGDLRKFVRWIEEQAIHSGLPLENRLLNQQILQSYLQSSQEKGTSPGTCNRLIAAVKVFERYQNNEHSTDSTLAGVTRTLYQPKPIPDATRRDLRALIKEFHRQQSASHTERQRWHAVRNWAILQVLRETNLRAGKVCLLRVESDAENYKGGILGEIFPGVELSTTARHALVNWLQLRKPCPGLLFTSYSGKQLQSCDLYRLMQTMSRRANVHVTPEML